MKGLNTAGSLLVIGISYFFGRASKLTITYICSIGVLSMLTSQLAPTFIEAASTKGQYRSSHIHKMPGWLCWSAFRISILVAAQQEIEIFHKGFWKTFRAWTYCLTNINLLVWTSCTTSIRWKSTHQNYRIERACKWPQSTQKYQ